MTRLLLNLRNMDKRTTHLIIYSQSHTKIYISNTFHFYFQNYILTHNFIYFIPRLIIKHTLLFILLTLPQKQYKNQLSSKIHQLFLLFHSTRLEICIHILLFLQILHNTPNSHFMSPTPLLPHVQFTTKTHHVVNLHDFPQHVLSSLYPMAVDTSCENGRVKSQLTWKIPIFSSFLSCKSILTQEHPKNLHLYISFFIYYKSVQNYTEKLYIN